MELLVRIYANGR